MQLRNAGKTVDMSSSLLLRGIVVSTENEEWKEDVHSTMKELYEIDGKAIKSLELRTNDDETTDVIITFSTKLHRSRVYNQRSKMVAPLSIDVVPELPVEDVKEEESSTPMETSSSAEVVESAPIATEAEDKKSDAVVDSGYKAEATAVVTETKADDAAPKVATDAKPDDTTTAEGEKETTADDATKKTADDDEIEVVAEVKAEEKKLVDRDEEEYDRVDIDKCAVQFNGAPEFQWRNVSGQDERRRLIIENVTLTDMTESPYLYAALQRAQRVEIEAQATRGNQADPNLLRKCRLTLTYQSDTVAMRTATNYLVFLRTQHGHRRLKIYLPQTPHTTKLREGLERRLGRVAPDVHMHMRTLMLRDVPVCADEEKVRAAMGLALDDNTVAIDFRHDGQGRNCAVLVYDDAVQCCRKHASMDEVVIKPEPVVVDLEDDEGGQPASNAVDAPTADAVTEVPTAESGEGETKTGEEGGDKKEGEEVVVPAKADEPAAVADDKPADTNNTTTDTSSVKEVTPPVKKDVINYVKVYHMAAELYWTSLMTRHEMNVLKNSRNPPRNRDERKKRAAAPTPKGPTPHSASKQPRRSDQRNDNRNRNSTPRQSMGGGGNFNKMSSLNFGGGNRTFPRNPAPRNDRYNEQNRGGGGGGMSGWGAGGGARSGGGGGSMMGAWGTTPQRNANMWAGGQQPMQDQNQQLQEQLMQQQNMIAQLASVVTGQRGQRDASVGVPYGGGGGGMMAGRYDQGFGRGGGGFGADIGGGGSGGPSAAYNNRSSGYGNVGGGYRR